MSLGHPWALWLLLLLPVPLMLARKRPPVRRLAVANLYLWRGRTERDTSLPTLRRWRRRWIALLQMAFLAATIAALARPSIALRTRRIAFVVDVSGSMAAHDGSTSRLGEARARMHAVVETLPRRSRVRLIAAAASAHDLGEYASTDAALARAIDALAPTHGEANIQDALDLTQVGRESRLAYVFSDGPPPEVHASAAGRGPVVWEQVGASAENAALVTLAARRHPLRPDEGEILAAVRNFGIQARDLTVDIAQDDHVLARNTVHVAARGVEQVVVAAAPLGRIISATLVEPDALEADNRRWGIVPPAARVRVALGDVHSRFLRSALGANPSVTLETSAGGTPAEEPEVVILPHGPPPAAAHGVLLISERAGESRAPAVLTLSRPDHPVAAAVDASGVTAVSSDPELRDEDGVVIARVGDEPAIIAHEHAGQRVVEWRIDTGAPDFPLTTAFPVLLANAIDWLAAGHDNPREVESGQPLHWTPPDAALTDDATVVGPDGRPRPIERIGQTLVVRDTDLPGVYRLQAGTHEWLFAAHAATGSESDLGVTADVPASRTTPDAPVPPSEDVPIVTPLLLCAAALFGAEWWFRRGRTLLRLATIAVLLLSAAGLAVAPQRGHVEVVALLDRSASMPTRVQDRGLARLNAVAGTMRPIDRLGVVAFGGDAVVERRSDGRAAIAAGTSAVIDSDTNIARAIRLATELLPGRGTRRLLLYSDGHETAGDARAEAVSAAAAGIPLDVLPPDFTGVRMAPVVTSVAAPPGARIDEPFQLSVDVHGDPGAKAQLGVYRDGALFATHDLQMSPAGEAVATFEDRQTEAGVHAYRAAVEDSGDDFDEERAAGSGALVAVSGVPTVLYVTTSVGALPPVLQSGGFRVTRVVPGSVPAALSALTAYDAVVLDDVAATSLAPAQLSSLAHYVEDTGGGLLVLGSPRTLDLSGYPPTALGRLLPVDLRPRSGQRAPSLGLVLVFDKSGSMADLAGGTPKIDIARQAVMRVLDVLPPTDSLGVIAFDREPVVVTPLVSPPSARAIADRLRDVDAGGQTRIAPAAALALRWLGDAAGTAVSRREILLLSDGRTTPEDADGLRRAVAGTGVHVSTVAIGASADRALLTELANSTGGRAYFPDNVADLPMVVSRAATQSSAAGVVTERLALRGGGHPALAGVALDALPRVDGYVVAGLKPTATAVLSSQLGDPVLCGWTAGLGRVLVFTGDLGSPWSDPLRRWTDYARLWRQSVRWVSRQSDDPSLHLTIAERDGRMRVVIDAEEATGRYLHLVAPVMTVRPPVGETRPVVVVAHAPGRYEAEAEAATPGPYVIEVSARDADTGLDHRVVRGFYLSAYREQERRGNDVGLLSSLAAATGGRVLGPTDSPFAHTRPLEFVDVSPWALSIVLAFFVIDLLSRSTVAEALSRWVHARGGWSAWNAPAA